MKTLLAAIVSGLLAVLCCTSALAQGGESPLKVGEQLRITLAGVPAEDIQSMANSVYTISGEGTIRVQYLPNEIRAAGLTVSALARTLERAYKEAEIYTNPVINVTRANVDPGTNTETVTVSGNVRKSGAVLLRPGMRITDAIAEAGGPDDFGTMKRVKLQRGNRATIHDVSNISNLKENILLQAGDSVHVPKGNWLGR